MHYSLASTVKLLLILFKVLSHFWNFILKKYTLKFGFSQVHENRFLPEEYNVWANFIHCAWHSAGFFFTLEIQTLHICEIISYVSIDNFLSSCFKHFFFHQSLSYLRCQRKTLHWTSWIGFPNFLVFSPYLLSHFLFCSFFPKIFSTLSSNISIAFFISTLNFFIFSFLVVLWHYWEHCFLLFYGFNIFLSLWEL